MTTENGAGTSPASPAAAAFEFHVHFQGAFILSLTTEGNSSRPEAKLTGVEVFTPACEHTNAATINGGSTYMLESYWHCIDPTYDPGYKPAPITLGQLQKNIGANTPWTVNNRPMGSNWDVAYKLPVPPEDWQCGMLASATSTETGPCFGGNDANMIPDVVALEQILVYKQVTKVQFHGACFPANFSPVGGITNLYLISEVPYIPTPQHERRAADAMAGLLGLDLLWNQSIGSITMAVGEFTPKLHTANCIMGIVTGPMPDGT